MMFQQETDANGEIILRFAESFDISVVRDLMALLCGVSAGQSVILDFTETRDLDYYGLSAIASVIANVSARVSLRGLSQQHARMLGYFGLDPASFGIGSGLCVS